MKNLFVASLLLAINLYGSAQDSTRKWQPSVEVSLTTVPMLTNASNDTSFQNILSIAPSFSIRNRNGLGITYSPKIVTGGATPGIYLHTLTAGYEQYNKENFDLVADFTHFFFTGNSSLPFTPITNEIYSAYTYKKSWIRPMLAAGIGFGTQKDSVSSSSAYDMGIAAGVGHAFEWQGQTASYSVIPSVMLDAGTNQYFSLMNISKYISHSHNFTKYVKNGKSTGKGKGKTSTTTNTPTQTSSTTEKQNFSLSNIELNIESELELGSFSIRPVGSLYVPVGSAAGSGVFGYWQLSAVYNF